MATSRRIRTPQGRRLRGLLSVDVAGTSRHGIGRPGGFRKARTLRNRARLGHVFPGRKSASLLNHRRMGWARVCPVYRLSDTSRSFPWRGMANVSGTTPIKLPTFMPAFACSCRFSRSGSVCGLHTGSDLPLASFTDGPNRRPSSFLPAALSFPAIPVLPGADWWLRRDRFPLSGWFSRRSSASPPGIPRN